MSAAIAALEPLDRSWAVLLTTYKRDGTPVPTPVNLATEDDHAYFRTYSKAGKTKRIANNPVVTIAPSTVRGAPTGTALQAHTRLLAGEEEQHARSVLARRYPIFQRHLIPFLHKLSRYQTLHYEVSRFDLSPS